jgi:transcriptional regulator with XRE-family HTH domain
MTQRVVSGAAIKAIREAHGLSVRDLAARIGLDVAQLHRFETEKRTPSDAQARLIADGLGVPLKAIAFATRVVIVSAVSDSDAA